MVTARVPGAGRGQGGGRPKREGPVELVQLRLSPQAANALREGARVLGVPVWQLAEDLILAGAPKVPAGPRHPPEALRIAEQIGAFLEGAGDRAAAVQAVQRAWRQAFALAQHAAPVGTPGADPTARASSE